MLGRTLATLVVTDKTTRIPETILILIPLSLNQENLKNLNEYITLFCSQRNLSLVIPADFSHWTVRSIHEFQCQVCNETCLPQHMEKILGEDTKDIEKFCSNFCRHKHAEDKKIFNNP